MGICCLNCDLWDLWIDRFEAMGRLLCGGICGRMGGASPLSNRQGCAGRVGRMLGSWGDCLNCDFWDSGMGCD